MNPNFGYAAVSKKSVPDRASCLGILVSAAVFHLSISNLPKYEALMRRAQIFAVGDTLKFRLCEAVARLRGFEPRDFHGFIEVVPMAEADSGRLQAKEGHACLR